MENSGLGGKHYDFNKYNLKEMICHTGFYLYHALFSYLQAVMMFYSSKDDTGCMGGNLYTIIFVLL